MMCCFLFDLQVLERNNHLSELGATGWKTCKWMLFCSLKFDDYYDRHNDPKFCFPRSGMVAMILLRTLHRDIATYNQAV